MIRKVNCNIYIEKFTGTVYQIDLKVNFDAQAGLIKNLPYLEYTYEQKLGNLTIFSHLYYNNVEKQQVLNFTEISQYVLSFAVIGQFVYILWNRENPNKLVLKQKVKKPKIKE